MSRLQPIERGRESDSSRLPVYQGEFVGREQPLGELAELLQEWSVVSIIGPPGVGKTRLATEVGRVAVQRDQFEDGVRFCDLRTARDEVDLIASVTEALQLPITSRRDPEGAAEFVESWLAEHEILLVLDNYEQLVEAGRATLEQWFAADGRSVGLVTTRRPLESDRAYRFELAPLDVDHAVELYRKRGDGALPPPTDGESREQDVRRLVERLDDLPLAIELAAARLPVLGPAALLDRLDRQLEVLREPGPDHSDWEPALRNALAGSWSLLEDWERAALRQLAVFRGSFSLDAAESVVDLDGYPGAPPVARAVQNLLEHSLLRPDDSISDLRLFGLYECVREFAREKLRERESPDDGLRERHARWFAERAVQLRADFYGADPAQSYSKFAALLGDIREAFEWSAECRPVLAAKLGHPWVMYLNLRKPYQDDGAILTRIRKALADTEENRAVSRARVTNFQYLGKRAHTRGELKPARESLERAVSIARTHEFDDLLVESLKDLGQVFVFHDELDRAEEAIDAGFDALDRLDENDDVETYEAALHCHAGNLAHHRLEWEKARHHYNRALTLHRQNDNLRWAADLYLDLGLVETGFGEFERAIEYHRKAHRAHRELGSVAKLLMATGEIGQLHTGLGNRDDAVEALNDAVELAERLRHTYLLAEYLGSRALVEFEEGNLAEASTTLDEALSIALEVETDHVEVVLRAKLAAVEFARGAFERAERNLEGARRKLEDADLSRAEGAVEIATTQRHLVEARRALERGSYSEADARVDEARRATGLKDDSRLVGKPELLVFARVMGRSIREFESEFDDQLRAAGDALHVDADRRAWFEWDDEYTDISRRKAPRRIFARLVDHRLESPGSGLEVDELVEVGWPDQTLHPEAARARVYTAIRTLREYGLEEILITNDEGYLLDKDLPILERDESPSSAEN